MASPTVKLSSGYAMPVVGLGTFDGFKDDQTTSAVASAIEAGYRLIDTAWVYQCEGAVGQAIAQTIKNGTVKREDLFVITKLWNSCHTRVEAAVRESLTDLGLDYLDLYLMHYPTAVKEVKEKSRTLDDVTADIEPIDRDYIDTWKDMEKLVDQGLVRSVGLSNFNQEQIERLLSTPGLKYKPVAMQLESHPFFTNHELVEYCQSVDIVPIGFSSLGQGGVLFSGKTIDSPLDQPLIKNLATKYKKTTAQVALRWANQRGLVVIPKSTNRERIRSNIELFDFELTSKEMQAISSLNINYRICHLEFMREHKHFPFVDVKARYGQV